MKVKYDNNTFELCVTDRERATWLDGVKTFYDLRKDYRPSLNPYDFLDTIQQTGYTLKSLAHDLPLNKVPQEVIEGLDNLEKSLDLLDNYANHVFGLILKEYEK